MPLYNETLFVINDEGDGKMIEQYEQPRRWHMLHAVLSRLDEATWSITDIRGPVEKVLQWWHERSCDDDCLTGPVWRRHTFEGVPPMPLDDPEGQEAWREKYGETTVETYCGRNPLEVAIAYRLYRIAYKDRRTIAQVPG